MTRTPTTGTYEEWFARSRELSRLEKEHTRRGDELARLRRELPWVPIEKDYVLDTPAGPRTLVDLFEGRSQLLVYHFMLGPGWSAGCTGCSLVGDHLDGPLRHLHERDVRFVAVSRAPQPEIDAYRERMGWSFPWVSSHGSTFNHDMGFSFTPEQQMGPVTYNYAELDGPPEELHGLSAFAMRGGVPHLTYRTYARGGEALLGVYALLDRTAHGRDEGDEPMGWVRRHDEYDDPPAPPGAPPCCGGEDAPSAVEAREPEAA